MQLIKNKDGQLDKDDVARALAFIKDYWNMLEYKQNEDKGSLIGLPFPYIVPSVESNSPFSFKEQYYWDSYFISLGLGKADKAHISEGMLENLLFLHRRFGIIPNANRMFFLSRSQPPLLTSYIFYIYDTYKKDKAWLKTRIAQAKEEYEVVWMGAEHPHWRQVYKGLSRYYDINVLHDLAEAESGWDMTIRFGRKCLDFTPIDLNSLLYKYEADFARAAEILGNKKEALAWQQKAADRKAAVNELMWSKTKGFFFEYNYVKKVRRDSWSLAGYYAMWANMATQEQAERMRDNLRRFERAGGLVTTTKPLVDMSIFGSLKTQWAYPNGWAPLHYIVIKGLRNYGFNEDADRIAKKWLKSNTDWFNENGEFTEVYNAVNPKKPALSGVYPNQIGFGWTNGVYVYLAHELGYK